MRYAIIVGILLIAIPLLLRIHTPEPFPDASSYEQLRTAHIKDYDSLYAKTYQSTLTDYIYKYLQPQIILVILAAIALFFLSFYHGDEIFILLVATSPAFIMSYTTVGPAAPGLALITLGAWLTTKKKYWSVIIIPVCFFLSFSLGILATITFIVVSLLMNLPFIALGASFFALISGTAASLATNKITLGFTTITFSNILGIFGASTGITIFLFFLGILGYAVQWKEQKRTEQLLSLLIIPTSLFFENGLALLAVFLAYYATKALHYLWNREWHFEELKGITFTLIACGLLFTAIVAERSRISVDTDRVAVTNFITAAYPQGTPIAAPAELAPILAYEGYPSGTPELPADPSFVSSTVQDQGYSIFVTKQPYRYPIAYQQGSYTVYELNQ